jgi:hypothetical protein
MRRWLVRLARRLSCDQVGRLLQRYLHGDTDHLRARRIAAPGRLPTLRSGSQDLPGHQGQPLTP